jgi:hypothetical protein
MEVLVLTRQTMGLPGLLGVIVLAAWLIGFVVFGIHGPLYHLLVPLAGLLIIGQGVRRINHED